MNEQRMTRLAQLNLRAIRGLNTEQEELERQELSAENAAFVRARRLELEGLEANGTISAEEARTLNLMRNTDWLNKMWAERRA